MIRALERHGLKIIGAVILVVLIISVLPQGRAFYKTLRIVPEFLPSSTIRPLNILTSKPLIREVGYQSQGKKIYADLWLPNGRGKHPAAVLHLGLDIDRKDPRVQKVASAFARSGLIILVPNIPTISQRRLNQETTEDFINSFEYLKSLPQVKNGNVGFLGFCSAGGVAFVASTDERIADEVAFITTINPYFDLSSLYRDITLRKINNTPWTPHFKTVEIFNRETINLLTNDSDKKILKKYLVLILEENLARGNFPSLTPQDEAQLTEDGKLTYKSLTNKDPEKVDFYLENATFLQKNFLKKLSPSTSLNTLKAKSFIFVDKNFVYIPYTEGEKLSQALSASEIENVFEESKVLPTSELTGGLSFKNYLTEGTKVFRLIYSFFLEVN